MDVDEEQIQDIGPAVIPVTEVIDPAGDVILNVGNTHYLRVSSKILSLVSKPFAAMLGPNFSEGKGLNSIEPPSVDLPEDDGVSVSLICKRLHHQMADEWGSLSSPKLTPMLALNMAMITHKYGMNCAIGNYLARGISRLLNTSLSWGCERLYYMIIASYVLEDAPLFRSTSIALLLGKRSAIAVLRILEKNHADLFSHFPLKVFCMLEHTKEQVRENVFPEFGKLRDHPEVCDLNWLRATRTALDPTKSAPWDRLFARVLDVWERSPATLNKVMSAMQNDVDSFLHYYVTELVEEVNGPTVFVQPKSRRLPVIRTVELAWKIKAALKAARNVRGLCFKCAKDGNWSAPKCKGCEECSSAASVNEDSGVDETEEI